MIIGSIESSRTVIGKIDVLRAHAAEIYAAPAVGEFFDCRWWRDQGGSIFCGRWPDVERAHAMLATIRSAMDREFADFFETGVSGENPKALAASFSKGMADRICERLRRLKGGRTATAIAKVKDLPVAFAKRFEALLRMTRRHAPPSSTIAYAAGVKAGDCVELPGRRSAFGH